eukprot:CAMPEP_0167820970 /NCGR_PEP_ID=MMETSP0112_2-20121227/6462_1 /TAXON_ID=91324 /ORGANISM="Lotharella globosa, Strain CCCM811" /LENGTH=472 /DNA_ID=CAMNT_0007721737 /DNA_START=124 /DNA_END=1542 /DNA_ORIENTATION=-
MVHSSFRTWLGVIGVVVFVALTANQYEKASLGAASPFSVGQMRGTTVMSPLGRMMQQHHQKQHRFSASSSSLHRRRRQVDGCGSSPSSSSLSAFAAPSPLDSSSLSSSSTSSLIRSGRGGLVSVYAGRRGGGGGGRKRKRGGRGMPVKEDDGIVANMDIQADQVRVISETKDPLGVMALPMAIQEARGKEMDLILVNPTTDPPLCRIMKLDKYRYELKRQEKEKSKQQRANRVDLKELKFRPNTGEHDYNVRLKKAKAFLDDGDRVKITCQFKGRELAYTDQGTKLMQRLLSDVEGLGTGEPPKMMGRAMAMIINPTKSKKEVARAKEMQQRGASKQNQPEEDLQGGDAVDTELSQTSPEEEVVSEVVASAPSEQPDAVVPPVASPDTPEPEPSMSSSSLSSSSPSPPSSSSSVGLVDLDTSDQQQELQQEEESPSETSSLKPLEDEQDNAQQDSPLLMAKPKLMGAPKRPA